METVSCEICGAQEGSIVLSQKDLRLGVTDEEFFVFRCNDCGFKFLNPRPTREEISKYYPKQFWGFSASPRQYSRVKRRILEEIYGYPSMEKNGKISLPGKILLWLEKTRRVFGGAYFLPWVGQGRMLDIGCGIGMELAMRRQEGWDVHGLDLSESSVEQAKTILGDRVQVGDLLSAQFKKESFDVIVISHTLEHVYGLREILAESYRVLKNEGLLVVKVPNAGGLEAKIFGRWWMPLDLPRHLYHFDKQSLPSLLKQSGFSLADLQTGKTSAYFMSSLEWFFDHRLGKNIPAKYVIEEIFVKPLCLIFGHLKVGTELIIHAKKIKI